MRNYRYSSTKRFDNFSVAIRQHKAQHSHCQLLHGYAFELKVWFASNEEDVDKQLDEMNWVVDFGIFKRNGLREWLDNLLDHTMMIEKDDPYYDLFEQMGVMGIAKPIFMDTIGAESVARFVFEKFNEIFSNTEGSRVRVIKVECFENTKNSAIYEEI
jgi:6-pyruvoyltetrahydropterin/6-carboxytetrahydropterin synthase